MATVVAAKVRVHKSWRNVDILLSVPLWTLCPNQCTRLFVTVHPSSECEDKVLHTAHTVGRLSNKVGRRVYRTLSQRLQNINKQNINEYLNNLTLVVQLTNYLNSVNQRVDQRSDAN